MNTTQINLTQQDADALELSYPMHESYLQKLVTDAEAKYGFSPEEAAALMAMPCMRVGHLAGVA